MRQLGVVVRQQVWIDGHPVDGLIGDRLVVQIDGFAHHQAADRRRDIAADARLRLRGYTVMRFDYHQLLYDWQTVVHLVSAAIAEGLHDSPRR
jgi:very-short-patch-repair endonuclease